MFLKKYEKVIFLLVIGKKKRNYFEKNTENEQGIVSLQKPLLTIPYSFTISSGPGAAVATCS